jgi:hypothetical protein
MQIIVEKQPVKMAGYVAVNKPADTSLRVRDGEDEQYLLLEPGHATETFQAAGAPGTHTAEALDADGEVVEAATFVVTG